MGKNRTVEKFREKYGAKDVKKQRCESVADSHRDRTCLGQQAIQRSASHFNASFRLPSFHLRQQQKRNLKKHASP
jgi:hypothetical protein